ncbi:UNVERIFIED_CONTAM: hypothetical protein Sangu_0966200 [Sesamum angustifolium]|uniref:DC-UbP/UBTD2 N-terminal domain-containing protein n=1 Tax=Sesamum angustifolium TaxID=2727405 RepID=A0AAW2PDC6_9LAMI
MRSALVFLVLLGPFVACVFEFQAEAAPADGNVLQFEDGYLVETVVEGNELGVVPCSIRVSQDGELFAVDAVNSNIVRITPPLSQYSRARLVAGSFQGHTGHVDGKPSDARFNHPKGVTMDDKGNVYVADTSNLAIRKIGEAGVCNTRVLPECDNYCWGKSNVAGYRDGPSEDAKFSNDFDVIYVRPTCSLLVIDRGNAALRQISLNKEDCDYENSSVSPTDLLMVAGAILIGYASCMLQQGFGGFFLQDGHGPMPSERFSDVKPPKMRSTSLKDPSLSSKHRSSRRQEYAEFYGSGEVPQYGQVRSKSQKERTKHRQREKSGDATFAAPVLEPKPAEIKPTSYDPNSIKSHVCLPLDNMPILDLNEELQLSVLLELDNMGCAGSSQTKAEGETDFLNSDMFTLSAIPIFTGTAKKIRKPKAWKHPQPITKSQLIQLREEFWDTAPHYGGTKAAEADLTLAQAIVDSAGIIVQNPDLTVCFDERGARYELPKYVLSEPKNLIRSS